jgi:hypothetical protein
MLGEVRVMSAGAVLLMMLAATSGAASSPRSISVRQEAKEWVVDAAAPSATGDASTRVDVHLTSRAGYHVNMEYPMAFLPSPDATVKFEGTRVALRPVSTAPCQGASQEVCSASLKVPFIPPSGGSARVAGVFAFSVCSAERCLIQKVPLSIELGASAPARR